MSYTLGQAAKATGVSKMTIQRAIKAGKISAHKEEDGSYTIDPAELHRVFPPKPSDGSDTGTMLQNEPVSATPKRHGDTPFVTEVAVLKERLASREEKIRDLEQRMRDIESQRDQWHAQADRLTLLLTAPKPEQPVEKAAKEPWYKRRLW